MVVWWCAGRLVPPGQGFHQLSATGVSPVVMALGPGGLAELYERPATSLAGVVLPTHAPLVARHTSALTN